MREYTSTLTNQGRRETEDRGESVHVCPVCLGSGELITAAGWRE